MVPITQRFHRGCVRGFLYNFIIVMQKNFLSSAYLKTGLEISLPISLIYIYIYTRYRIALKSDPWRPPLLTEIQVGFESSYYVFLSPAN